MERERVERERERERERAREREREREREILLPNLRIVANLNLTLHPNNRDYRLVKAIVRIFVTHSCKLFTNLPRKLLPIPTRLRFLRRSNHYPRQEHTLAARPHCIPTPRPALLWRYRSPSRPSRHNSDATCFG